MRITIEEDSLNQIKINNKETRDSLDTIHKKNTEEFISNDIEVELIDNTLIIFNSPNNSTHKIRLFFKKKEVQLIRKMLDKIDNK